MQFQFKGGQRHVVMAGLYAVVLIGAVLGSYQIGYTKGSGDLTQPPLKILLNTNSTGELSVVLDDPGTQVDFGDFWRTWYLLDKNFAPTATSTVAASTTQAKVAGAIEGLVRSYGDPYTVFIPKENANNFKEMVNGEFEGIGAALIMIDGSPVIAGLLPDSPAQKIGLQPGTRIVAVDGQPTVGQDLPTIISHIRGPKGSTVSLTLIPDKSHAESVVTVTRGMVVIPTTATRVVQAAKSVVASAVARVSAVAAAAMPGSAARAEAEAKAEQVAKQKFFVLLLASFARTSIDAFITDLKKFAQSDTQNLIIDLRDNPGGYLDVACDLASYFLPKDALVVTQKTGAKQDMTECRSKGYPLLEGAISTRRIVVLLNHNSASASEILAGALREHGVAKIVGETSFGKGSVQTLVDIGQLGTLKITVARWYLPRGTNISHAGIVPDIAVDTKDPKFASSTDPYMDVATETLLDDSLWK